MPRFARDERRALAALLIEVGPEAETLCRGWTTHDLAAHLVARERRPDSTPGILLPAAKSWTDHVRERVKTRYSYPDLVTLLRKGPPWWSPLRIRWLDETVNMIEFYVHHEDVRRAASTWAPRDLSGAFEAAMWAQLRRLAPRLLKRAPSSVRLEALGVDQLVVSDKPEPTPPPANELIVPSGQPTVTLRGLPSELVLYCYGRRSAARLSVRGDERAVAALASADLGY